jgi:hypothetical protein
MDKGNYEVGGDWKYKYQGKALQAENDGRFNGSSGSKLFSGGSNWG